MNDEHLIALCQSYLAKLCREIPERCVGSAGNRLATQFFAAELAALGWSVETPEFAAIDWKNGGATIKIGERQVAALVSPYSLGCDVSAPLMPVKNIDELEQADIKGKILLLRGDIAYEQIMPKNFLFYNPEEHQRIVGRLEAGQPAALICATGYNAIFIDGLSPFPLFEDGDFNIPSVYMLAKEGEKLLPFAGQTVFLRSVSQRIPATGNNVMAQKGRNREKRIVITAHIDAKKGTPGAIDNATGVTVLLLLARLLADYNGENVVEIVALNGEDYYAVPGQMLYLQQNQDHFDEILLNINIDGAGYKEGKTAVSFFELPEEMAVLRRSLFAAFDCLTEGAPWPQGDHSIFVQNGRPAIAITSEWFLENMYSQDITHTQKDNLDIVNIDRLLEIARAIQYIVAQLAA